MTAEVIREINANDANYVNGRLPDSQAAARRGAGEPLIIWPRWGEGGSFKPPQFPNALLSYI